MADQKIIKNVKTGEITVLDLTQAEMDERAAVAAAAAVEVAKAELLAIDAASVRALREYIASKADAPQILKDKEAAAIVARAKLK